MTLAVDLLIFLISWDLHHSVLLSLSIPQFLTDRISTSCLFHIWLFWGLSLLLLWIMHLVLEFVEKSIRLGKHILNLTSHFLYSLLSTSLSRLIYKLILVFWGDCFVFVYRLVYVINMVKVSDLVFLISVSRIKSCLNFFVYF
jgi:hypothetical protein